MPSDNPLVISVANYDNVDDAKWDFQVVKDLHRAGIIGDYDAALVTRDNDGDVHIQATEKPTEHAAGAGLATGAMIGGVAAAIAGIFFPPVALAGAAVGALGGAAIGHVREGLPRKDLEEFGDALQNNSASLVVVAESTLGQAVEKALSRASRKIQRGFSADAKQFKKTMNEAITAASR